MLLIQFKNLLTLAEPEMDHFVQTLQDLGILVTEPSQNKAQSLVQTISKVYF
jgi:hypothetical protein